MAAKVDRLEPELVHATVERLHGRIVARFPKRGLVRVATELSVIAGEVRDRREAWQRQSRIVRWLAWAVSAAIIAATAAIGAFALADAPSRGPRLGIDWVPLIEATINDLVFAGIALFFLWALPERVHRRHVLATLHRLRSLAHVVDMHQLTKDPERLRPDFVTTANSIDPGLDRDRLEHYLDYCSELLSLIGKVAALCAEESQDGIVLETVSTIETMTTGMSGKIWQKISLLPG